MMRAPTHAGSKRARRRATAWRAWPGAAYQRGGSCGHPTEAASPWGPQAQHQGMAARSGLRLSTFFNRDAVRSGCIVGTLMVTGDALAQQLEGKNSRSLVKPTDRFFPVPGGEERQWNASRSARLGVVGIISAGPISHWTYVLMSHFLPGTAWLQVAKKAAAVVVFQSPFQISMTFTLVTLFADGTLTDAAVKLQRDLPKTWFINAFYWLPILTCNMKLVALRNQAAVGSVAHAVWNIFLAYMANQTEQVEVELEA